MDFRVEYAYNESFYGNGTDAVNATEVEGRHPYNYYAMLLTLLIFVIVFGNVLVCMAVSREKALQTTTNYLIVSLAVADLLVATLVMPWVVYLEVVGEWRFSRIHCDIFVTLDVMMCTASILNLCAISIDSSFPCHNASQNSRIILITSKRKAIVARKNSLIADKKKPREKPDLSRRRKPILLWLAQGYTAVAMPMLYNTRYSSKRRVTVMISVVWFLSFAISCPLLFGLNNTATRDDTMCVIANPAFVVYSSIVSFYVPFIITLLVYVQIYVVLRKRRKRVSTKRSIQRTDADATAKEKCTNIEDVKLSTVIVKSNGGFTLKNKKVILIREAVQHSDHMELDMISSNSPLEKKKKLEPAASAQHLCTPGSSNPCPSSAPPSPAFSRVSGENGHAKDADAPETAKAFETQALRNSKTHTSMKTLSKRKISQQKEKKATQMLAIVLGVFIICWLPFFITHILNTHCTTCKVPVEMYNAFTWLGYVNSAVNPIIYTTFNVEFRKAFIKILHY